ncbi:MAG TPA: KUP/HAK/KT family potassium transporter, partial [Gemmatimonadales bacterium]|nr:KUP/HAK/KT family potassium transporter [Gemmatimonadales bacterium]
PMRVPGTAVYLTTQRDVVPAALALNLKHNGVLHDRVVLLKVSTSRTPRVAETERVQVKDLSGGMRRVELTFGFAEKPDVPSALAAQTRLAATRPPRRSFSAARSPSPRCSLRCRFGRSEYTPS